MNGCLCVVRTVVNIDGPINTFDTPRAIGQAIRTTLSDAMATAGLR